MGVNPLGEPGIPAAATGGNVEEVSIELQQQAAAGKGITVRGLRKEYATPDGTLVAVAGLDLTMYEGQIFCLLGHNGAGACLHETHTCVLLYPLLSCLKCVVKPVQAKPPRSQC